MFDIALAGIRQDFPLATRHPGTDRPGGDHAEGRGQMEVRKRLAPEESGDDRHHDADPRQDDRGHRPREHGREDRDQHQELNVVVVSSGQVIDQGNQRDDREQEDRPGTTILRGGNVRIGRSVGKRVERRSVGHWLICFGRPRPHPGPRQGRSESTNQPRTLSRFP